MDKDYTANSGLVRWETRIKEQIEKKTFKHRRRSDYNTYLQEESKNNSTLDSLLV